MNSCALTLLAKFGTFSKPKLELYYLYVLCLAQALEE
jgi:hypothetical protein